MTFNSNLEKNIPKLFFYSLSQRRHFITLLSIYFMTLPNSTANQIGLYSAIGLLVSFFLELPSGYISDNFGHKKTLILSKMFMTLSMISFIIGDSFWWFALGSAMLSTSFAFNSGTFSAFLHDTLEGMGKEKNFSKIRGKIGANVSLVSMFLIITLPFLTQIDILLPFYINLIFDIVGLFIVFNLKNPKKEITINKNNRRKIISILSEAKNLGVLPFSIFSATIIALTYTSSIYKEVYLVDLGFPIIFIGTVMGLSRFVWFLMGHNLEFLKKMFSMKNLLIFEIIFFTFSFMLISYLKNPYFVGFIFIIMIGYMWGRTPIFEEFTLNNYTKDKNYKATILSVNGQLSFMIKFVFTIIVGFIMGISYPAGFLFIGLLMFLILTISFLNIDFKNKIY